MDQTKPVEGEAVPSERWADFVPAAYPPPVWIDPEPEWYVHTATRYPSGGFSHWSMMTRLEAIRWGQMRPGAYAGIQAYPSKHATGTSKGRMHAGLLWMDFDGPDLLHSCRAAFHAIDFLDRSVLDHTLENWEVFTIRYSGNRSIHLGVDLGVPASDDLTRRFGNLVRCWREDGHAEHVDLGLYTEPRLLPIPGSIRYNRPRRVTVMTIDQLLEGCARAESIEERAELEATW